MDAFCREVQRRAFQQAATRYDRAAVVQQEVMVHLPDL